MAASQSWSSWLLGTYSNGAPSIPTEAGPENHDSTSPHSEPLRSNSATNSSSPYGPYIRTGRGGAGNFTWQSQDVYQNKDDNLEALKPSTLSERRKAAAESEHLDTGAAMKNQAAHRPVTQYIRVGRGMVQSNEPQISPNSERSSGLPTASRPVTSPLVAHSGRGGAGNQAAAAEQNERALREIQEKERIAAEQRREKIEEEIQSILPPPAEAWLGGRRRSVDLPERPF